ncbi:fatty acid desaturase [Chamaesiphon sp. VAR_69_metabat_338]|uniref:fatty acid desaturase n=1 Tax=Chamaesiphon sp. VAR_69_metabat_338 TaxID=2964704 RepID=UPI00286D981F|nr:fatty acid desaturase [Chamaesiphon sp. VAR_69_metabat_338]
MNNPSLQIALTIIGLWTMSLWSCLHLQLDTLPPLWLIGAIGWQTWLYTGLFITAHDAMHGSIHPLPQIDRAIGRLCLWLYAGFDYSLLAAKHHLHHQYPASERDPDFHDGTATNFLSWYAHFVCEHFSWPQAINLVLMLGVYASICYGAAAHGDDRQSLLWSIVNPIVFWAIPSLLSSLQLFYFGTFLPHREPPDGYSNSHRARTIARSHWWSLLSCYHFGYHQEHHQSPYIPWWQLYRSRQSLE